MLSVGEYARAVVPCGTTGIFMDSHEICNVCGPAGVKYMIEDAKRAPLKAMSNAPSCVPAVAGFEDTGSSVTPADIREITAPAAEIYSLPRVYLHSDSAYCRVLTISFRKTNRFC